MLAKILFVGVQHGTDNFGQELFHLLACNPPELLHSLFLSKGLFSSELGFFFS